MIRAWSNMATVSARWPAAPVAGGGQSLDAGAAIGQAVSDSIHTISAMPPGALVLGFVIIVVGFFLLQRAFNTARSRADAADRPTARPAPLDAHERHLRVDAELERLAEVRQFVRRQMIAADAAPTPRRHVRRSTRPPRTSLPGYRGAAGWLEVDVEVDDGRCVVTLSDAAPHSMPPGSRKDRQPRARRSIACPGAWAST
jgi:hypothetical protein